MTKARANAVAEAAKGDLSVGTGTNLAGILAVGNSGEQIVADSSTSTGLRYQANWAAGKNKIINGDFNINQRAFTSTTVDSTYTFDRWQLVLTAGGGTVTGSAQTFTPGAAPVAGYEAFNFARLVTTGQTLTSAITRLQQPIEGVNTFAGQTVTFSFWAKAASGTPNIAANFTQNFGSGGSSQVVVSGQKIAIGTTWQRYSFNFNIPSISGKTVVKDRDNLTARIWVSAGSSSDTQTDSLGIQSNTFDIWGVQVEAGSVATAFQTATGTLQGELAACQRYYYRKNADVNGGLWGMGQCYTTTRATVYSPHPVPMRTTPSIAENGSSITLANGNRTNTTAFSTSGTCTTAMGADITVASGLVAGNATTFQGASNLTTYYIEASAEL